MDLLRPPDIQQLEQLVHSLQQPEARHADAAADAAAAVFGMQLQLQLQQLQSLQAPLQEVYRLCASLQALPWVDGRQCSSSVPYIRHPAPPPCPCQHAVARTMRALRSAATAAAAQEEALDGGVLCELAKGLTELGAVLLEGQHTPGATQAVLDAFIR